ncbi:DUF2017 family protein [Schumannella soli]|uniref:DUF2017 family protein n=1 Tax=Schumannella soli TaxID=2590779 RepID=A0A506XY28_9MICO|nr:DUF2017 family protein [Schumannella soli]TPW74602.1 DUF2017 family protein [Schumannella soli]
MTRVRAEGTGVRVDFAEGEAGILAGLAEQLAEIVDDERDPARGRMLPSAYPDDAEADAEFRRWTTSDLVDRKAAAARRLAARLHADESSALLDPDEADGWARTLTDLRTALASRLGIETDDDAVPNTTPGAVYEWLGQLQWTLIEALDELDGIAPTEIALPDGIEHADTDDDDDDADAHDDRRDDDEGGAAPSGGAR